MIGVAMFLQKHDFDNDWLKPREVAEILGVSVATVSRWAREGMLEFSVRTPGGHRRYRRIDILTRRDDDQPTEPGPEQEQEKQDLVRLYEQGWPIRQVAEVFGFSYSKTRRIIAARTTLRDR
jgi:excisionase family DNA binding protein